MWFANTIAFFVLLALLIIPLLLCGIIKSKPAKFGDTFVSAVAGVVAGYVFYTIYVLWQTNNDFVKESINMVFASQIVSFIVNTVALITGLVAGISFMTLIYKFVFSRYIGILNLLLTAAGAVTLHNFFFVENSRVFANYFTLSLASGILIHVILNPKPFRDLFI